MVRSGWGRHKCILRRKTFNNLRVWMTERRKVMMVNRRRRMTSATSGWARIAGSWRRRSLVPESSCRVVVLNTSQVLRVVVLQARQNYISVAIYRPTTKPVSYHGRGSFGSASRARERDGVLECSPELEGHDVVQDGVDDWAEEVEDAAAVVEEAHEETHVWVLVDALRKEHREKTLQVEGCPTDEECHYHSN